MRRVREVFGRVEFKNSFYVHYAKCNVRSFGLKSTQRKTIVSMCLKKLKLIFELAFELELEFEKIIKILSLRAQSRTNESLRLRSV